MDTRGAQEVIVSSAYQNLPTYGYHVLQRFTKETFGSFLFSSVRRDWEQHVPDPSNDSLYPIKPFSSSSPEGSCGGNQQNPSITNDLHDLPQWFHVFATSLVNIYIYIYTCHRESSRTPQHSKWNCVGTNRPQHRHMYGHIVCD